MWCRWCPPVRRVDGPDHARRGCTPPVAAYHSARDPKTARAIAGSLPGCACSGPSTLRRRFVDRAAKPDTTRTLRRTTYASERRSAGRGGQGGRSTKRRRRVDGPERAQFWERGRRPWRSTGASRSGTQRRARNHLFEHGRDHQLFEQAGTAVKQPSARRTHHPSNPPLRPPSRTKPRGQQDRGASSYCSSEAPTASSSRR